jgi:hypothetical protein
MTLPRQSPTGSKRFAVVAPKAYSTFLDNLPRAGFPFPREMATLLAISRPFARADAGRDGIDLDTHHILAILLNLQGLWAEMQPVPESGHGRTG